MWISQDQALDFYTQLLIISGLHIFIFLILQLLIVKSEFISS